jgi:hypothetical protein
MPRKVFCRQMFDIEILMDKRIRGEYNEYQGGQHMVYKGKIKTQKRRRVCKFSGCGHILSIYNPETYCHVHQQLAMMQVSAMPLARR